VGARTRRSVECPGKDRSPREHPVVVSVNRAGENKGLPGGSKPGSRVLPVRPEDSSEGAAVRETARGFMASGNVCDTSRAGESSEGRNPRSAVGMK
jgi:hypothetical protein